MRRVLFITQVFLFTLFNATLLIVLFGFAGNSNPLSSFDYKLPVYNHKEEFDPSLKKLATVDQLKKYCDTLYQQKFGYRDSNFERNYSGIVAAVVKKRFYHGYSHYSVSDNYFAVLFSKATKEGYSAIVVPDDILKYPYAACSQQSIVTMEVLQLNGITTRKVGFQGTLSGHFGIEVLYDGGWHFYDPNMEPDPVVLDAYNRPGIDFLVKNPDVLLKAYRQYPPSEIMDIFPRYFYGDANQFPAPRGILFQKLTKFLSYFIWLLFLALFIIIRRKYLHYNTKKDV